MAGGGAAATPGGTAAATLVKVDNAAAAKRRPKSTKRKKPSDTPTGGGGPGTTTSLHPATTGGNTPVGVLSAQTRLDGLTTPGAKSDSSVKLETGSIGGGDDSGIIMSDTWQRNGHSADFIRHSLGEFVRQFSPHH